MVICPQTLMVVYLAELQLWNTANRTSFPASDDSRKSPMLRPLPHTAPLELCGSAAFRKNSFVLLYRCIFFRTEIEDWGHVHIIFGDRNTVDTFRTIGYWKWTTIGLLSVLVIWNSFTIRWIGVCCSNVFGPDWGIGMAIASIFLTYNLIFPRTDNQSGNSSNHLTILK